MRPLRIDVVSLFGEMFSAVTHSGITRRARERGIWELGCWNPRDYADDGYRTVDDRPYGGGPGMVMMARPLEEAVGKAREVQKQIGQSTRVVYLSPQGQRLSHLRIMQIANAAGSEALILVCGRYEGVDERFIRRCVDEEVSVGDFVVSGGELPAMMMIDAIVRQLPGVLNDALSAAQDSYFDGLLDCPHYTRPEVYEDMKVPEILMSGNHQGIRRWRLREALGRTLRRRPEMLEERSLTLEEAQLLDEYQQLCGQ